MVTLRQGVIHITEAGTTSVTDAAVPLLADNRSGRAMLVQNDVDSEDSILVGSSQAQAHRLLPGTSEVFPGNPHSIYVKTLNAGQTATARWTAMS